MPYDGIVTHSVVWELSGLLKNGRIERIFQTEKDELLFMVHSGSENYRLLLSACSQNPRVHLTKSKKENPLTPPQFCLSLRKHVQGGKISEIIQYGYDRIMEIKVESSDQFGEPSLKKIIIEIMGKYSNIILTNAEGIILDSIKHVDNNISSVREVMPARHYTLPPQQNKLDPDKIDYNLFLNQICQSKILSEKPSIRMDKYLLETISGFSPLLCKEVCFRAEIDPDKNAKDLTATEKSKLQSTLEQLSSEMNQNVYQPTLIQTDGQPIDFHCYKMYHMLETKSYGTINLLLDDFYTSRDIAERLKQKKSDLTKNLSIAMARCKRKMLLQQETSDNSKDYDVYRVKGELITANLYRINTGSKSAAVENYYCDPPKTVVIDLDENITPQLNAANFFKKYRRLKSSYENAQIYLNESLKELEYLTGVMRLLENCTATNEIQEIKDELSDQGYIKFSSGRPSSKKIQPKPAAPEKFTFEGYDIFVGKNNRQNDYLTLKLANSSDVWLHVKNQPGSHCVIRSEGSAEIPQGVLNEAARLAAYYSSARGSSNVPIDYTNVKYVKKPSGSRPGMVTYTNYRTIFVKKA